MPSLPLAFDLHMLYFRPPISQKLWTLYSCHTKGSSSLSLDNTAAFINTCLTQQKVSVSLKAWSPPFSFLFCLYTSIYFSLKEQKIHFHFQNNEQTVPSSVYVTAGEQGSRDWNYKTKLWGSGCKVRCQITLNILHTHHNVLCSWDT